MPTHCTYLRNEVFRVKLMESQCGFRVSWTNDALGDEILIQHFEEAVSKITNHIAIFL